MDSIKKKFFKILITAIAGGFVTLLMFGAAFILNLLNLYFDLLVYIDLILTAIFVGFYFYWVKDSMMGKIIYSVVATFIIGLVIGLGSISGFLLMFAIPGGL